jgi:hypothetical protein
MRTYLFPLSLFFGCQGLAFLIAVANWIPEWELFQKISIVVLMLGALVGASWLFWNGRRYIKDRIQMNLRILVTVLGTVFLVMHLLGVSLLCAFAAGGIWPPEYHHQVEFPEYGATLYIFDTSFLDASATVYLRKGWLPFMHQVGSYGMAGSEVEVTQAGNVIRFGYGSELDLATGDLVGE